MNIEPIKIIQPIHINPVSEIQTDINEQSEGLGGNKLYGSQKKNEEYLVGKKEEEKKDKEKLISNDFNEISEKLKTLIGEDNIIINFSLDDETNKMIMQIIDSKTNEIIHQFPPEISLKIARIVANTLENWNIANATV